MNWFKKEQKPCKGCKRLHDRLFSQQQETSRAYGTIATQQKELREMEIANSKELYEMAMKIKTLSINPFKETK